MSQLTVYYDGACPLCRAEIGHYRRCAGAERLDFVDVGSDGADSGLGPGLDRATARRRFHVRDTDGRLRSGAAAFARLWLVLPRWRWLGRIAASAPILPLAEIAYRLSLRLRPHLARLVARYGGRH